MNNDERPTKDFSQRYYILPFMIASIIFSVALIVWANEQDKTPPIDHDTSVPLSEKIESLGASERIYLSKILAQADEAITDIKEHSSNHIHLEKPFNDQVRYLRIGDYYLFTATIEALEKTKIGGYFLEYTEERDMSLKDYQEFINRLKHHLK